MTSQLSKLPPPPHPKSEKKSCKSTYKNSGLMKYQKVTSHIQSAIWALTRQNLSSGFQTKRVSTQSPQLQRLARKLELRLFVLFV